MTQRLARENFLKAAGGAVLAAAGFFYPGITKAAGIRLSATRSEPVRAGSRGPNVRRMDGSDPTFAGGEVAAKVNDGIVLQSGVNVRLVRLPPNTVVWKEFDVTPDAIQLHDWVDVKGTPLSDGSLLARSGWVWVNIGRRDGTVEEVSSNSLTLKTARGVEAIELSPRLEVIKSDGSPLSGVASLPPGAPVGVVGLRLPGGGFRATRIWEY
jgi:hypothetical protein